MANTFIILNVKHMHGNKLSDYKCNQGNSAINMNIKINNSTADLFPMHMSSRVYHHCIPISNKERKLLNKCHHK